MATDTLPPTPSKTLDSDCYSALDEAVHRLRDAQEDLFYDELWPGVTTLPESYEEALRAMRLIEEATALLERCREREEPRAAPHLQAYNDWEKRQQAPRRGPLRLVVCEPPRKPQ